MMLKYYSGFFGLTLSVSALRVESHVPSDAWRCCFAPEWNSHSGLSRLALYRAERTLQLAHSPFPE